MLTKSSAHYHGLCGDRSLYLNFQSLGSLSVPHRVSNDKRSCAKRRSIQSSQMSDSGNRPASLAYARRLSLRRTDRSQHSDNRDQQTIDKSVTDAVAERMYVIPYSELILQRTSIGGHSPAEAIKSGSNNAYCWEESWKQYMQSQKATLEELSASLRKCDSRNASSGMGISTEDESLPLATLPTVVKDDVEHSSEEKSLSELAKLRAKRLERRKMMGLLLLNVLAALYGSSTVAGKFVAEIAPELPASLSSLVRYSSALLVFLPALSSMVGGVRDSELLKAGAELGGLLFAAGILETCGDGGASSDAPLLFAFTVIFVPLMELWAGRQPVRNITRIAPLVALSGMGVLEEEGFEWKGISLPQVGDIWGLAASAIYALHIFRSEAHSKRFKPFELTAIQCSTVASLSVLWEVFRVLHDNTTAIEYVNQLQSLPWGPLVYTGLVCSGLCSWLEIHGLRAVHASTATMVNTTIPIWGAFLSFVLRGETLDVSAMVGGLVILVTSFFAQSISHQDDTLNLENPDSRVTKPEPKPMTQKRKQEADHVQGAIITSQLKFPYYAAQAKRLLVEAKFKLATVKSLFVSMTSTLLTNAVPLPQGSLHPAAPTVIALQQAASAVSNAPPSLQQQLPSTSAHSAIMIQWLDVVTGVLESAITAIGSDVVQALEEAESVAKVLEQTSQKAMEHTVMAAGFVDSLLDMPFRFSELELVIKSVDTSAAQDHSLGYALHQADSIMQILLNTPSP